VSTEKKELVGAKRILCTRMTFSQLMTATVGMSKLDGKGFIFIDLGMKIGDDVFL